MPKQTTIAFSLSHGSMYIAVISANNTACRLVPCCAGMPGIINGRRPSLGVSSISRVFVAMVADSLDKSGFFPHIISSRLLLVSPNNVFESSPCSSFSGVSPI